jgi:hypothetical protein
MIIQKLTAHVVAHHCFLVAHSIHQSAGFTPSRRVSLTSRRWSDGKPSGNASIEHHEALRISMLCGRAAP